MYPLLTGIKLAPEILEPEPIDIQDILHRDDRKKARREGPAGADGVWSGEATRSAGFNVSPPVVEGLVV